MFEELLPASFIEQALKQAGVRCHNRVYSPLVVLWLLIAQRLHGRAPLEKAVIELLRGLPASFWPTPCKRIRDWRANGKVPSAHTGAYNQARQALPVALIRQSCDRIFEELIAQTGQSCESRAFVLDGTTIRMAHSPSLCQSYPPGSNQHGDGHWPLLRVLVAHDLQTGLAMRPEWGPMHGPEAVSEQGLLEKAIGRLPEGSTLIGDANFGVFSVAYAGQQAGHPVLLRLTPERAKRLAGEPLQDGIDRPLLWQPSRADRKSHPELPADARNTGRFIVRLVQPNNGAKPFLLILFTTLTISTEKVLELYGRRWNIETDLRILKSTLGLDQLTCTTPDMVAKEMDMAIAAYNLVRAVTWIASEQSGIAPRGYSFTRIRRLVNAFAPKLAAATTPQQAQRVFDELMQCVQRSKLYQRRGKRPSYPRAVWNQGARFPNHST
ncbi:MAG: IS4 family transposase [Acidobacteria bacterium]|nr:IS4 family transposase [Acidobacteriota bacterium]